MPALRIKIPHAGEKTHFLEGERVTVGRARDNTIPIPHGSVSSHHAEFVAVNGRYRLRDLQSTNRSYVEGMPITECDLEKRCRILFGSVECEFDPASLAPVLPGKVARRRLALPVRSAPDTSFLDHENRVLRERVHSLQRRFDVLGNARMSDGKAAAALRTPSAPSESPLQTTPPVTVAAPPKPAMPILEPLVPPPAAPDARLLPGLVVTVREAITNWAAVPDAALLARLGDVAGELHRHTEPLGSHAIRRLTRGLREFLRELLRHPEPPTASTLRTLRKATDLFGRMLEPRPFAAGRDLPPGQVLALDDDADLLATVCATLESAQLVATGCDTAEAASDVVASRHFDAIIADVRLPGMNGPAFVAQTRDLPAYRRTPILFLTVADTLDQRAESSLSGGNEFIAKPFNVFELALKVETWVLKHQLRLLK